MLAELFLKTLALFMFAYGTVLGQRGVTVFKLSHAFAGYFFFAALVLFCVGSILFLVTPWSESLEERRKRARRGDPMRIQPSK